MEWKSITEAHGIKGETNWELPILVMKSNEAIRIDQGNVQRSDEFMDTPQVLQSKVHYLCENLLKHSSHCVAYCGAGLSKSSGIADYASNPSQTIAKSTKTIQNPFCAEPTLAHHVLAYLSKRGLVKEFIQQNHDGLPQKSGVPQYKVNEIHGALFDPSNPVVQFNGSLRQDLFQWLLNTEVNADLCLCLGTSLSSMNADRIPVSIATRFAQQRAGLGTVIINLQRTHLDKLSTLRIWGKLDDVFEMIAKELGSFPIVPIQLDTLSQLDVFDIPYNSEGLLDTTVRMRWDLREDSQVKIAPKEAINYGKVGKMLTRSPHNDYLIAFNKLRPTIMGKWMVIAAINGELPSIPVINTNPQIWKHGIEQAPQLPPLPEPITGPLCFSQSHYIITGDGSTDIIHKTSLKVVGNVLNAVKKVVYKLPPHCDKELIACVEPPFEMTISEKGVPFDVQIEVTLKGGELSGAVINTQHKLHYETQGDNVTMLSVDLSEAEKPDCSIC